MPAGFPPVPQYPLRTVASPHPSQNRACTTHAHGSSTTRFAEEVTIGSPEFAGEATGSVGAEQPELLEIQTATLSTPAWPFEKYQFHLIGKAADTPAVTRYSVIRIMPSSDSWPRSALIFMCCRHYGCSRSVANTTVFFTSRKSPQKPPTITGYPQRNSANLST